MAATIFKGIIRFEGYLLSTGNASEAAAWCGGTLIEVESVAVGIEIANTVDGYFVRAGIGDYITKDLEGFFQAWTPEEFLQFNESSSNFGSSPVFSGPSAAQGTAVEIKGATSTTSANAGGAAKVTGGVPGATGVGGAAIVAGGAGGSTSGAGGAASLTGGAGTAGNANGGNAVVSGGAKNGTGLDGHSKIKKLVVKDQGAPTAKTTAATLTIAELLTGILTGTHSAGATQAYALPTGTLTDAGVQLDVDESFDWVLINLSAAALDTITVTAGTDHTIVGNPIVQSAHASTGGIYGNSAQFRTRKTAANTFVTYRIA